MNGKTIWKATAALAVWLVTLSIAARVKLCSLRRTAREPAKSDR